jgi:hypothetical protein
MSKPDHRVTRPARSARSRLVAPVVCAAVTGGLVLAGAGFAGASTPSGNSPAVHSGGAGFKQLQKALEDQLTDRQQRLGNLTKEVSAAKHLTTSDRATLVSDLGTDTTGIDALAAKVPNDTTIAELATDYKAMVDDYRVYLVMTPKVQLTITADATSSLEHAMQAAEPKIEALIRYEHSKGRHVRGAQIAYEGMVHQVSNAEHDTTGVAARVLATEPSGWPGNRTVFTNASSSLEQAGKAIHTAQSDVRTIYKDLGL